MTYNGEEIGMVNTAISWEDTVDPAGLSCGEEHYTVSRGGSLGHGSCSPWPCRISTARGIQRGNWTVNSTTPWSLVI